jgi:hypothetical protein
MLWTVPSDISIQIMKLYTIDANYGVDTDLQARIAIQSDIRCPGCWRFLSDSVAVPLDLTVYRPPKVPTFSGVFAAFVRRDLLAVLLPHLRGGLIGRAFGRNGSELTDYVTLCTKPSTWIEDQRGRYSVHNHQCRVCGRVFSSNGWSHPSVLRREMDDRQLYLTDNADIYIREELYDAVWALVKGARHTVLAPVPILDEPQDGQVLPGDPGWTGTLVKKRLPEPPKHRPERGGNYWL